MAKVQGGWAVGHPLTPGLGRLGSQGPLSCTRAQGGPALGRCVCSGMKEGAPTNTQALREGSGPCGWGCGGWGGRQQWGGWEP